MGCTSPQQHQFAVHAAERGQMEIVLNKQEDYITHHLKNELMLSSYVSGDRIRRRQIIVHSFIDNFRSKGIGSGASTHQMFIKSYLQRIFLEIIQTADTDYFQKKLSYDETRKKIADKFLFELYQLRQFADATISEIDRMFGYRFNLSIFVILSDSCLFPALKYLKDKYPQVADKSKIQFPEVKQLKNDINLLDNFPSKCFSEPGFLNRNTLFSDLKFLIDRSIAEYSDFAKDMKEILGEDVLTDSKVKLIDKDGRKIFNASPVRRVFIKWVETLIERNPQEVILTEAFVDFIRSKKDVSDQFHIKSSASNKAAHNQVIEILTNLLEAIKYNPKTLQPNKKFGFFIYDLLRCKTHRKTGQEVVELLKKMQNIKTTTSGKKFQVVRVKNRFKTPNRDLMVNFRYGDVLVAEAQLCIDTSDVDEKTNKTNKFNHYIYELERGLFGPTMELMMQYEDFYRPDVEATMYAVGQVKPRTKQVTTSNYKFVTRKCPSGHEMVEISGNKFISKKTEDKNGEIIEEYPTGLSYSCDFCLQSGQFEKIYHYCTKCSLLYCLACEEPYKKVNPKDLLFLCNREDVVTKLTTEQELIQYINQFGGFVVFHSSDSASLLQKDFITYLCVLTRTYGIGWSAATFQTDSAEGVKLCKKYEIKRLPTTVVFDKKMQVIKRITGANEYFMQSMNILAQQVGKFQSPLLKMYCNFHEIGERPVLKLQPLENFQNWKCGYCPRSSNNANWSQVFDIILQIYQCPSCQVLRCFYCGLFGNETIKEYIDYQGQSYLSSVKRIPSKSLSCPNTHPMSYIMKNPNQDIKYKCFKCQKGFYFTQQNGMSICQQCSIYACPQCTGIQKVAIKQNIHEIANQYSEATASQAINCAKCNYLFKKVYRSKKRKSQNQEKRQQDWTCVCCRQEFQNNLLHLACFGCGYQICLGCARLQGFFKGEKNNLFERQVNFLCRSSHPFVVTQLAEEGIMTIDCNGGCKKKYYANTQHFNCKICKINYCKICGPKFAQFIGNSQICIQGHPIVKLPTLATSMVVRCQHNPLHKLESGFPVWKCTVCVQYYMCHSRYCIGSQYQKQAKVRTCPQNHQLTKNDNKPSMLAFCNECVKPLKAPTFQCIDCNYDICMQCAYN